MAKSMGIRKGDTVEVITGDDGPRPGRGGRRGKVVDVDPVRQRVTVEGVHVVVKHRRGGQQTTAASLQTGRIEMPAPIHRSNVRLVCPHCDQPTRVTHARNERGFRVRQCRECGEMIDE